MTARLSTFPLVPQFISSLTRVNFFRTLRVRSFNLLDSGRHFGEIYAVTRSQLQ